MLALRQELGWMKSDHAFDYYATLPIPKSALIFAIATRSILLSLFPIAFIFLLSMGIFDVVLAPHPAIILVIFLSGYSLAGIGAFIGFYSPNGRVSNLVTQIIQPIIIFLSPVFVPREDLPKLLQLTSNIVPTTYVARALRDMLADQISSSTWLSLLILFMITLISLFFVEKGLDWRGSE